MMSDIYINEATGKKIKVYKQAIVHVYDHEDPSDILDFTDSEECVADWCVENMFEDDDNYDEINKAYDNKDWGKVIELTNCRHCNYEYDYEWAVEEVV
jgi:hypothetical protein